jgi:uncharacterized protein
VTPTNLGIQVEEERGPDQVIARLSTARTAFVGRTLRGPVNRPVLINSFSEFQHAFGGLWQPSPLGYAVEQFFENGGREALILRVVNGARAASLSLRAGTGALRLRAVRPGTREFLRASIDYDNLPADEPGLFNLTVQRVRAQGTAQVEDQEIFQRLCLSPDSDDFVTTVLGYSEMVRVAGELPPVRPEQTFDPASGLATAYITSSSDGDDGAPLTDYDLIGSAREATGLFALQHADYFNLLCVPPLSRDRDVGLSVLLVAARFCKERRALLIVDPPAAWHTADDALRSLRGDWSFAHENALMYFPRVLAHDKLRGHFESFAPCGAVAGMLARGDDAVPIWTPHKLDEPVLRPGCRPTCLVTEENRARLLGFGVNVIQPMRLPTRAASRPRTLANGTAGNADWQYLTARRFALFVINCVERGTRWVALVQPHEDVSEMLTAQLRTFFEGLYEEGAFGNRRLDEAFFLITDARARTPEAHSADFQFVVGFAATREHELHAFRVSHTAAGSKVAPVSPNRLNFSLYSPAELDWVEKLARQLRP